MHLSLWTLLWSISDYCDFIKGRGVFLEALAPLAIDRLPIGCLILRFLKHTHSNRPLAMLHVFACKMTSSLRGKTHRTATEWHKFLAKTNILVLFHQDSGAVASDSTTFWHQKLHQALRGMNRAHVFWDLTNPLKFSPVSDNNDPRLLSYLILVLYGLCEKCRQYDIKKTMRCGHSYLILNCVKHCEIILFDLHLLGHSSFRIVLVENFDWSRRCDCCDWLQNNMLGVLYLIWSAFIFYIILYEIIVCIYIHFCRSYI